MFKPTLYLLIASLAWAGLFGPAGAGELAQLTDDVRADRPSNDSDDHCRRSRHRHNNCWDDDDDTSFEDFLGGIALRLAFVAVTSPVAVPRNVLMDESTVDGFFPRYPYQHHAPGYMMLDEYTSPPRSFAARFRSEYSEDFDDLSRIGMHLLLSTTSRFGIDTETNYLQERLPNDRHDHLWLGDCNLVYRFAQSPRAQWRAGIGLNWLDDPIETNYGFNFTYGFDLYPVEPLVLSTELDWGTLGSAEAFHFRTTAGAVVHGLEAYVGYEYRDIDRFHSGGLVAGVRLWF